MIYICMQMCICKQYVVSVISVHGPKLVNALQMHITLSIKRDVCRLIQLQVIACISAGMQMHVRTDA